MDSGKIIEAVAWYVVFLFSVTVHEAAHAWMAKRGGDLTAYHGGQVSLDPWPHIRREPIGMVVLPLISVFLMGWPFGYASAPYDPSWAYREPKRAAWMALAGPASNLALTLLSGLLIRAGMLSGMFAAPSSANYHHITDAVAGGPATVLAFFLSIMFTLNLVLAVLNLIPLPPLDGSGAISLVVREETARRLQELFVNPAFRFLGLFIAWKLFDPLFDVVFVVALNVLYPGSNYS